MNSTYNTPFGLTADGKPKKGGPKVDPAVAAVHAFLRQFVAEYKGNGRPVDEFGGIRDGLKPEEKKWLKCEINRILEENGKIVTAAALRRRVPEWIDEASGARGRQRIKQNKDNPEQYQAELARKKDDPSVMWQNLTDDQKARQIVTKRIRRRKKSDAAAKQAAAAIPVTTMPGILRQTKEFFDDKKLLAVRDVIENPEYGYPTLHHITEVTALLTLPGQVEPNILHSLKTLVDAGLTPECRVKYVKGLQQRIKDGTNKKGKQDVQIHKDVYMTPAPSVAVHHARYLIDKSVKLHWHMCHCNTSEYSTFRQVYQLGHHCDMFVKTNRSVPSDAIYESDYDASGKLVGWNLVWTRTGSDHIEWDSYMDVI